MKKKLYLVRHGQTIFNRKGRIQGWCDSPLTDLGRLQARAVKDWLDEHGQKPDSFYCSDLRRTEQTLQEITDQDYIRKSGLREFGYGLLEGELATIPTPRVDDEHNYYVQFGGESHDAVIERMDSTLREILETDPANTVLAISHGSSSFLFAHSIDPEKAEALRKRDNCVIYDFDYEDGKFTLNDIINEHVTGLTAPDPVRNSLPDQ